MPAKPKPPTGCRIKGGRYYRVRYVGKQRMAKRASVELEIPE
jgi:hypothetical protein